MLLLILRAMLGLRVKVFVWELVVGVEIMEAGTVLFVCLFVLIITD